MGQATERPAGLPENFRTVAALAESYKTAHRKITELATENKQLQAFVGELLGELEELRTQQAQAAFLVAAVNDHEERN